MVSQGSLSSCGTLYTFASLHPTRVIAARGNSSDARQALSELADSYYAPVVAFLKKEGRNDDAARDLAHSFFASLLSRDALATLEPNRSRFRSYLLGALKHFIVHQREKSSAQKRGSQITHLPIQPSTDTSPGLDPPEALALPPDQEFDRQWALHLISQALTILEAQWNTAGKSDDFENLRPFLDGNASHGALAEKTGQNENTLRSQLHRLRRSFRQQPKSLISPTVPTKQDVTDELQTLVLSLSPK